MNDKFIKSFRLAKVDEATHTAYGLATSEAVDCDGEIADYDGSKLAFQEWSDDFLARTTAAGQDPSLGNIRLMHNVELGGKAVRVDFKDDQKEVWLLTAPLNDDIWEMLKGGFITGYSIGGRITKRKKEGEYTRYWFKLSEVSYVDNPANPEATFAYVKSNGSVELRKFRQGDDSRHKEIADNAHDAATSFSAAIEKGDASLPIFSPEQLKQITDAILLKDAKTKRVAGEDLPSSAFAYVGDKEDTSTWKLPLHFSSEEKSKRHVRNALARFSQTQGIPEGEKEKVHAKIVAAAKKYGIEVADEEKKAQAIRDAIKAAVEKALGKVELKKAMFHVSILSNILQDLAFLYRDNLLEAEWEGDDRDDIIAVEIGAAIEHLVMILKEIVDEETSELIPALKAAQARLELLKGESTMDTEMINIAQELADLAKAGHSPKAFHTKMAAMHEKMAAHHEADAEEHEDSADSHDAMCEAHKAAMGTKAEDPNHTFHKAGHEHHKTKAASARKLHKSAMKKADQHKAMAEVHKAYAEHAGGLPEGDKAAADAAAKAAADKAAADAAAKAAGAATDPNAALVSMLGEMKKSFDAMRTDVTTALAAPRPSGTGAPVAPGIEVPRHKPNGLAKAVAADDHGI